MERKHNKTIIPYAKALRKNMTKEERHLWYDFLRTYPVKFSRQKVLGRYIVDFYCSKAKLAVELDGSQHFEEKNAAADAERTAFLKRYGVSVLRIPNNELNHNFRGVCECIDTAVEGRTNPGKAPLDVQGVIPPHCGGNVGFAGKGGPLPARELARRSRG